MSQPYVVEAVRSGAVESTHLIDVAVVEAGALVAGAGDPEIACAFRSSAKPIQARAALEAGWVPTDERHLAVACASHSGEPEHVATVRALLDAAGVSEAMLACPYDFPLDRAATAGVERAARVFHNCSGKHAGMLAACSAAGWPLEGYREPSHPLQERIATLIGALSGETPRSWLVDGCGVPTPVARLAAWARAFAAVDGGPETAAMRAHPFLVGGTERPDTDLVRAEPALVMKGGAEGLACISLPPYGIAMKSRDGSSRYRAPVVLAVLEDLGLANDAMRSSLADHPSARVLGGGEPVGALRAVGRLSRL